MSDFQASYAPVLHRAAGAMALARDFVSRRANLLGGKPPADVHGPHASLFLGELSALAEPVRRIGRGPLPIEKAAKPRVVIILPGFATHPIRMRYMAQQIERAGHTVKQWGMGVNLGPTEENFALLARRVEEIHNRYGEQVVLVGWSLGGIFAREMAKLNPQAVSKVITMGSPFSQSPYSNNVWRLYQMVTGHSVENPPVHTDMAAKPPVETVALWSPRDGIVSPRSACGKPGERDRAIALRCTHMGFSHAPEVIMAVVKELEAG